MTSIEDSDLVFVYSTFPDRVSAEHLGRVLVEQKLAACVNVHGPMTSIYRWDGKVESAEEFAAFIKTRRPLASMVVATAKPLHPYSVPSFLVLPIDAGNPEYLDWASLETRQS